MNVNKHELSVGDLVVVEVLGTLFIVVDIDDECIKFLYVTDAGYVIKTWPKRSLTYSLFRVVSYRHVDDNERSA